jgi:GWxTD domain-containing protein
MTLLESMVRTALAHALGWTLLHSLWEGAVIALALTIVLAATRAPRARYAAGCLAMLALLGSFSVTLFLFMPQQRQVSIISEQTTRTDVPAGDPDRAGEQASWSSAALLPWLAPFWLAGVLILQIRYVAGWFVTGRLKRAGVYEAPDLWLQRLGELQARLKISAPVALVESCLTEVPVVIGYLRPVILMPVGLLTGMPAHQIEAILVHELAHIRRRDYLVNLIQTSVESLLFYHPAVWWISSVIRNERENCCDDLAVATSGNAHEYARALASLAETRWSNHTALAATGGSLMTRIRRLLSQPAEPRFAFAPVLSACLLTITAAATLAAWPAPAPQNDSPYQRWIREDVVYIATAEERTTFAGLQTDEQRQHFVEQFWDRRNPVPGSAVNDAKVEHYRRIGYANERYKSATDNGWKTDRGRIYIKYGPPDEIESHPSPAGGKPAFEQWKYYHIEGVGENVIIEFDDVDGSGAYRMTSDPSPSPLHPGIVIGPDGVAHGQIPIEFDAPLYAISGTIKAENGKMWSNFTSHVERCSAARIGGNCAAMGDMFRPTVAMVVLPPGSYTMNAFVPAPTAPAQSRYVVNFSVK